MYSCLSVCSQTILATIRFGHHEGSCNGLNKLNDFAKFVCCVELLGMAFTKPT